MFGYKKAPCFYKELLGIDILYLSHNQFSGNRISAVDYFNDIDT